MEEQSLEDRLSKIEEALAAIADRNRRVELEKAWETSTTRIVAIVALTYALMCLIFAVIGVRGYFANAIIPTAGYFLSTQSLPVIKRKWLKFKRK